MRRNAPSHARIVPSYVAFDGSTFDTRNNCSRGRPAIASPTSRSDSPSPYISAVSTCTMPSSMPRRSARFASSARAPRSGMFQVPWPMTGTSRPVLPNGRTIMPTRTPSGQEILRDGGVLGRKPRLAHQRPRNADARVAPAHGALGRCVVRHAVLVVDDDLVVEREGAVAKARRYVQLLVVAIGEHEALPLQVRRRLAPQVDDRVPNSSLQALHELGHPEVVVQPAEHVARRPRARVLREALVEAGRGVFGVGPRLLEKTAIVFEDVGNEHARLGELRRENLDHAATRSEQVECRVARGECEKAITQVIDPPEARFLEALGGPARLVADAAGDHVRVRAF